MVALIGFLYNLLVNPLLLLAVKCVAFSCKLYWFIGLIRLKKVSKAPSSLWLFVVLLLGLATLIDTVWVLTLLRPYLISEFTPGSLTYAFFLLPVRLGWLCSIIEFTVLALFLERLIRPSSSLVLYYNLPKRNLILYGCGLILACFQLGMLVWFSLKTTSERPALELVLCKYICFYSFFVWMPVAYDALRASRSHKLPKILAAQLKIVINYILLPYTLLEVGAYGPFAFLNVYSPLQNFFASYPFITISTVLLTCAFYLSTRKMMGLRFLNTSDHVNIRYNYHFIKDFKDVLEQLAYVTTLGQVKRTTYGFLKHFLGIPKEKVHLFIRTLENENLLEDDDALPHPERKRIMTQIEQLFSYSAPNEGVMQALYQEKILIKDELEFTAFYEHNPPQAQLVQLLNTIGADVLVPLYDKQTLIGYIVIERKSRPYQFFSSSERDELVMFATYLSNTINFLRHGTIQAVMREQKSLREELYLKHQEINQYKESIKSFIRTTRERKVGLVFYKHRQFSYGNQAAQELLGVDITKPEGQELLTLLKRLVEGVATYNSTQTITACNTQGHKLMLTGVPSIDKRYVIITLYYPEIADTLFARLDLLKDPSDWDYILYLETTKSGRLISQLIPGSGELLLNTKINLLKAALGCKAVLIDMPDEDRRPAAEIIHHISLRSELHILKLTSPEKNQEVALKLFGINPLFGAAYTQPSLLEKLNTIGTLFIENVHFLSLETQNALADFIRYGFFRPLKSDRTIGADVRIVCSSSHNLSTMVSEETFSATLLNELHQTTVRLPPLMSMERTQLEELMNGYIDQAVQTAELKHLIQLNEKDRSRLIEQKPLSLQEFKEHIHNLLLAKAQKQNLKEEITFNPTYDISDPELSQAVKLGKHALKDTRIMTLLWNKFKNQTKIATLLGVNRSSVNRRCKEYNLLEPEQEKLQPVT